jgi:hypothetical protein
MELTNTDPTPREGSSKVSDMPFASSTTKPFFPPVCLTYHWDPTAVLRHVVPQGPALPLALDPRPWTKVCLEYKNTGNSSEMAPTPPIDVVFPPGGEFYPPARYSQSIDRESLLRRQDRPLGTCDPEQYEPPLNSDMYIAGRLLPERAQPSNSSMVQELAMPQALLRASPYDCRVEADKANWVRSPYLFNNATKQQKYNVAFPTKKLRSQ